MERAVPAAARVIWQASPDYRLVIANNSLGFGFQALNGTTWKTIDEIPAFALRPMLMQFGLISHQVGYPMNGGHAVATRVAPVARSGTSTAAKTSTASRV